MTTRKEKEKEWGSFSSSLYVFRDTGEDDATLEKQSSDGNFLKTCILAQRALDKEDLYKALELYIAAEKSGSVAAMFNHALMLERGMGIEEEASPGEYMSLYKRAAAKDLSHAKHRLGYIMALSGEGGSEEGASLILSAAESGNHAAMYDYGMMCMYGVSAPLDEKKGAKWLTLASTSPFFLGSTAAFELAMYYYRHLDEAEGNAQRAGEAALHAAHDGQGLALDLLGQFYLKGIGVELDVRKAFRCFHVAAKKGVMSSKRDLAILLETGKGCEKDMKRAVELYRECVETHDDVFSKFRLGMCYYHGIGGLRREPKLAIKFVTESAARDLIAAKMFLLKHDLVQGDDASKLKAEIAAVATSKDDPSFTEANEALVSLGLVESCLACGISKYQRAVPLLVCSKCNKVKYCSKACQQTHWRKHRADCELDNNDQEGGTKEKEAPVDT